MAPPAIDRHSLTLAHTDDVLKINLPVQTIRNLSRVSAPSDAHSRVPMLARHLAASRIT